MSVYRHFKGGMYRLLFQDVKPTMPGDHERYVVYVSLQDGHVYIRTHREFFGKVDPKTGQEWHPQGGYDARFVDRFFKVES